MNPTPSLYDISQIPTFPWVPDSITWLIFAALLLLVILFGFYGSKLKRKPRVEKLFQRALTELEILAARSNPSKEEFYRASMIVRRVLTAAAPKESAESSISEMSAHEIEQLKKISPNPALSSLLSVLLKVERMKYSPDFKFEANLIKELYGELLNYSKSV